MVLFKKLMALLQPSENDQPGVQEKDTDPLVLRVILLLEAAIYDDDFADVEREWIQKLLEEKYRIPKPDIEVLFETARKRRKERNDLFEFTPALRSGVDCRSSGHFIQWTTDADRHRRCPDPAQESIRNRS